MCTHAHTRLGSQCSGALEASAVAQAVSVNQRPGLAHCYSTSLNLKNHAN